MKNVLFCILIVLIVSGCDKNFGELLIDDFTDGEVSPTTVDEVSGDLLIDDVTVLPLLSKRATIKKSITRGYRSNSNRRNFRVTNARRSFRYGK